MSAKINDMYYAYSAIEDIKEKGEYGGVVTTIMKYLLEEGIVDGVVGVTQGQTLLMLSKLQVPFTVVL